MKSRLDELKYYAADKSTSSPGAASPKNDELVIDMALPSTDLVIDMNGTNEMGMQMEQYYKEVESIEQLLLVTKTLMEKLKKVQVEALNTVSTENQAYTKSQVRTLTNEAAGKIQLIKDQLCSMDEVTQELRDSEGSSAVVRIREQQHANLTRQFAELVNQYKYAQEEYQIAYKARMKRTLKIVNQDVTDQQVDELLTKQEINPQDVFQSQLRLTSSQKHTLDATYQEVYETHQEILELDRGMREIKQLFIDLATLMREQEDLMDNVAHNVTKANNYVDKGIKNTKTARKYQKKSRWLYCAILGVIILAILAGGVVLSIVLGSLKAADKI
ncbi:t-SNARE family protein [Acrasis kona]|uniref:t-SNARE family protein n=1 Tax=Acrasis kona TaxID=1008807 RepID=A0AAW2Z6P9_9EUKA